MSRKGALLVTVDETSPRDTLLQMTNAIHVSQAICVAATLGIADLLEDGPKSADELAKTTRTHAPSLYRLLRALASVGIFSETDGRFGSTPLAEYLRTNAPKSLRAWVMQMGQQYRWRSWGDLLHSVRTGEPAFPELYGTTLWKYLEAHPEEDAVFNAAMTALSAGVLEAIVQSYDFSGMGVLMDVGGGGQQVVLPAGFVLPNHNLAAQVLNLVTQAFDEGLVSIVSRHVFGHVAVCRRRVFGCRRRVHVDEHLAVEPRFPLYAATFNALAYGITGNAQPICCFRYGYSVHQPSRRV